MKRISNILSKARKCLGEKKNVFVGFGCRNHRVFHSPKHNSLRFEYNKNRYQNQINNKGRDMRRSRRRRNISCAIQLITQEEEWILIPGWVPGKRVERSVTLRRRRSDITPTPFLLRSKTRATRVPLGKRGVRRSEYVSVLL